MPLKCLADANIDLAVRESAPAPQLSARLPRQIPDTGRGDRGEWPAEWDWRLPKRTYVVDLDVDEIDRDRDMFLRAVDLVVQSPFGAAQIVSPADGSKPRDVLVRPEYVDSLLADVRDAGTEQQS